MLHLIQPNALPVAVRAAYRLTAKAGTAPRCCPNAHGTPSRRISPLTAAGRPRSGVAVIGRIAACAAIAGSTAAPATLPLAFGQLAQWHHLWSLVRRLVLFIF